MSVPQISLSNSILMPQIGLGTWKSKPGEVAEAVKIAIDSGYRHIDCALVYGNECEVGAALKEKIDDKSVKRDDLFITSKIWNTFHSKEEAQKTIRSSLQNLKLDYLDLYLIHWPMGYKENDGLFPGGKDNIVYSDVDYLDTWAALEEMVDEGLVKSIGLSNFNSQQIERILGSARIMPVILQVECHPLLNQEKLIEYCVKKGIRVTAYSPLGSPDRPWAKTDDLSLMANPIVNMIAESLKKTAAQVLIRYQIQRGVIVIPKSVTKSRIESNFDVFDFALNDKEMEELNSINKNYRFCGLEWMKNHSHYPFHNEF